MIHVQTVKPDRDRARERVDNAEPCVPLMYMVTARDIEVIGTRLRHILVSNPHTQFVALHQITYVSHGVSYY